MTRKRQFEKPKRKLKVHAWVTLTSSICRLWWDIIAFFAFNNQETWKTSLNLLKQSRKWRKQLTGTTLIDKSLWTIKATCCTPDFIWNTSCKTCIMRLLPLPNIQPSAVPCTRVIQWSWVIWAYFFLKGFGNQWQWGIVIKRSKYARKQ